MKTYVNCPKCDDEFEFDLRIECDGAILVEDEKQGCDCKFPDSEIDALRSQACSNIAYE